MALALALSSSLASHALLTRPTSSAAALPYSRRRAAAPRCSERQEWLSTRVREALLDDAEKLFTVWTEGEPRPLKVNLDLLAHRARVLLRRGDESGAMETWKRCQELDPSDGRAWLAMAKYQARIGAYDEAERTLRSGLKWEPESAFLLQTYGWLQEKRGAPDEALALYSSAVRGDPRHAASWVACGLLLERRRRKEAAWRCLRTARLVAPDSYYVHQVVGQAHVRRGELGLAREAFRRSLVLNKRNAATMHAWGVLEWRCGHTDAARALFDKALKASPSNRYVLQSWACLEARAGASKEAKVGGSQG
jgi:tetratricopeptide (TPR) repeat protein